MKTSLLTNSKLTTSLICIVVLLFMGTGVSAQKVEIFHRTGNPTKFTAIKVNKKALAAHLAHGDHYMTCGPHEAAHALPAYDHSQCGDGGGIGSLDAGPWKRPLTPIHHEIFTITLMDFLAASDCLEASRV